MVAFCYVILKNKQNAPLIISAALVLFFCTTTHAQKIKAEDAKNYISQTDTVVGKVFQVHSTDKALYINIGAKYPDNPFTAVIFAKDKDKFGGVQSYNGKTVEIIGVIIEYNGKPEIVMSEVKQIVVVE